MQNDNLPESTGKPNAQKIHEKKIKEHLDSFFDKMTASQAVQAKNELLFHYLNCEDLKLERKEIADIVCISNEISNLIFQLYEEWSILKDIASDTK